MSLRVTGNNVLVEMLPDAPVSTILEIPETAQRRVRNVMAKVVSIGARVTLDIKIGDVVSVSDTLGARFDEPYQNFRRYDPEDLIYKVISS